MAVFTRRIMGIETEYGISAQGSSNTRALTPDEVARELFRPIVDEYASSNIFVPNASRLYLDVGSHPEVATAECDSLSQLLAYERAGDMMVNDLALQAEASLAAQGQETKVYLFKNNVDSAGNSYGCHENYLVSRTAVLRDLGKRLLPFMVTRQLICGAGFITKSQPGKPAQFILSQRADHVWEGVSSATTRSRPIINTRDEPHGDSSRYRRMHVIVGDSNMSESSFALKVGTTLLMLEMIEAEFELPRFDLAHPIEQLRAVARDLSGQVLLELEDGTSVPALQVQRMYWERAREWLEIRPQQEGGTSTEEMRKVVTLWEKVLDALESGDIEALARDVDWAMKYQLLQRYRDRLGCGWDDPKLAQVDLTFHDIRPGRGLYDVLMRRGLVNRWIDDESITFARDNAPATTRAHLRGSFLTAARKLDAQVTVDWMRLKVSKPEPLTVELTDPFSAVDARVDELIQHMFEHHSSQGDSNVTQF